MYNHQVFNSVDEFMTAFRNGTLKRLPERPDQDPSQGDWSTRKRPQPYEPRDLDHLPGPRQVSFAGLHRVPGMHSTTARQGSIAQMG